jgi:N-acetylmuramic acid 6-phosphate etherase
MQASTALMLGIGVALLYEYQNETIFSAFYKELLKNLTSSSYADFAPLTILESDLYKNHNFLNYVSDPTLAISILTDTTERSPTFSLRGFENRLDHESQHSLSYLFIPEGKNSAHAWSELLARAPRPVDWKDIGHKIDLERLLGFDISKLGMHKRSLHIPTVDFICREENGKVHFECQDKKVSYTWGNDQLFKHLMVKMILNAHSTLIMGLLGRYEGNVMTWVRPSNNKLIDRAARYVLHILNHNSKLASYEEVVLKIFEEIENLKETEPVVMNVVDKF